MLCSDSFGYWVSILRRAWQILAAHASGGLMPKPTMGFSVFTAEYMLAAIVEARDVQQLYEAQNKAKAKLKRVKGG